MDRHRDDSQAVLHKAHPHKGFYYDIEAFNNAGYSVATHPSHPKV